jgi:hypothetical protein
MGHAWINNLAYADIKEKWDVDTCIKFLMLSETTQKRLPGAPRPHKPCAVKEIVSQQLHALLILAEKNKLIEKPPLQQQHIATEETNVPANMPFIDTLNLLTVIIRRFAFPSYPNVILPIAGFTTAYKLNQDVIKLQQQLIDMVTWLSDLQRQQ